MWFNNCRQGALILIYILYELFSLFSNCFIFDSMRPDFDLQFLQFCENEDLRILCDILNSRNSVATVFLMYSEMDMGHLTKRLFMTFASEWAYTT